MTVKYRPDGMIDPVRSGLYRRIGPDGAPQRSDFMRFAWCFIFAAVLVFASWGWSSAASAGWISHRVETTITASSGWMEGESKSCQSDANDAFAYVHCDNGPERRIKVNFWGRRHQPGVNYVSWTCVRSLGDFSCYETSAH